MPEPFTNYSVPKGPDLSFLLAKAPSSNDLTAQSLQLQDSGRATEATDMRERAQAADQENVQQQMALRQRDQQLKEILYPLEVKQKGLALQQMLGEIATSNFKLQAAQKDQADKTAKEIGYTQGVSQNPQDPLTIPPGADQATVAGIMDGRLAKRADTAQTDAGKAETMVATKDLELYKFVTEHDLFHGTTDDWSKLSTTDKGSFRRKQTDIGYLSSLADAGVDLNDPAYADIKDQLHAVASNPGSLDETNSDYNYVSKLNLDTLAQKAIDRKKTLAAKDMLGAKSDEEIRVVKAREDEKGKARADMDAKANEFKLRLQNMRSTSQVDTELMREIQRVNNNILLSDTEKATRIQDLHTMADATKKSVGISSATPASGVVPASPSLGLPPAAGPGAITPAVRPPPSDFARKLIQGL